MRTYTLILTVDTDEHVTPARLADSLIKIIDRTIIMGKNVQGIQQLHITTPDRSVDRWAGDNL